MLTRGEAPSRVGRTVGDILDISCAGRDTLHKYPPRSWTDGCQHLHQGGLSSIDCGRRPRKRSSSLNEFRDVRVVGRWTDVPGWQACVIPSTFAAKESKTLRFLCSGTSALTMDAAMGKTLVLVLVAWIQLVAPLQLQQEGLRNYTTIFLKNIQIAFM